MAKWKVKKRKPMKAKIRLNCRENYTVEPPDGAGMTDLVNYALERIKKAYKQNGYTEPAFMEIWNDDGEKVVDYRIEYDKESDICNCLIL